MATLHVASEIIRAITNITYPVGSIYMSTSSTSPASFLGGSWTQWGQGRVPVGINTNDGSFNMSGKTGGSKSNSYSFNHTHALRFGFSSNYANGKGTKYTIGETVPVDVIASHSSNWEGITTNPSIGEKVILNNKTISTVQPYIVCYMWKRTA